MAYTPPVDRPSHETRAVIGQGLPGIFAINAARAVPGEGYSPQAAGFEIG
jgi:hypothetical protein